ncbi:unnamed protein product [Didymodactylos carnosus]|uniref:Uncharacterized protein n=1 Tax=Didymodactylos carnosus TaxID=1234261 RepID=A0A814GNH2_9BILA|nr:unnamed protein product [Didymodactylos carnosus]CAF0998619.1 unnamed protein product [Didymodactylos carnosus]CAF3617377.1 unnamed protein product [Didymodactylos carnosus]CAF3770097.1 unnamed protein product [Didymodactylos carnosus]
MMKTIWKSFELTQYLKIAFEYNEYDGNLNIFLKNDHVNEQQSSCKFVSLIANNIHNWELESNIKCKHHNRNDIIVLDHILTDNVDDYVTKQHVINSAVLDSPLTTQISSIEQCIDNVTQQSDNYIVQQENINYTQQEEQQCEVLYMQLATLFVYDDELKQEQKKLYPYEMNYPFDTDDYDLSNSSLTPSDDGYASVEEKIHEHHCTSTLVKQNKKELILYERETLVQNILYQNLDKFFYIRRFVSNLLWLKPLQHTVLTMMS